MEHLFEQRLWQFYRNVYVAVERCFLPVSSMENLTIPQIRVLFTVNESEELPVGELSAAIRMNPGNCSTLCKKLEQAGLIQRSRSRRDERVVCLRLTEKGKTTVGRMMEEVHRTQSRLLEGLTGEEMQTVTSCMDQLEAFFNRMKRESVKGEEK